MFSPADERRLQTWTLEIVRALLPPRTDYADVGLERRWRDTGGLSVHRRTGLWYCHAEHKGGGSALSLIRYLRPQHSADDAITWAIAFLSAHPGTGTCTADQVNDEDARDRRKRIQGGR